MHSGGVTVLYRAAENFSVEDLQTHGANIVSFHLASGNRWWYIVGCYFPPDDASTIEDVVAAIGNWPWGAALLVVGYFNTKLDAPEGPERDEGIAAALVEEDLEDMSGHLFPRHKPWLKDGHTWDMHRGGQEVHSRTNYIIGTDSRLFQNIVVWDARHNTEHYLILGFLRGAAPAANLHYLGKHTLLPIIHLATLDKSDQMFAELRRAITSPSPTLRERHRQAWISPETWSLIDTRIEARHWGGQWSSWDLTHAIKAALQGDR